MKRAIRFEGNFDIIMEKMEEEIFFGTEVTGINFDFTSLLRILYTKIDRRLFDISKISIEKEFRVAMLRIIIDIRAIYNILRQICQNNGQFIVEIVSGRRGGRLRGGSLMLPVILKD